MSKRDKHRKNIENLLHRLGDDPAALSLARDVARLVGFEFEHSLTPEECLLSHLPTPRLMPAKRTAIISDIHGNHAGLLAALSDIEAQQCDRILCLGDLVEGGPDNEGVIEAIKARAIPTVRGNHDENHDVALSESSRHFLSGLPDRLVEADVMYIHISPRHNARKITDEIEAWNVFDESNFYLLFVGHAHVPNIFGERSDSYGQATRHVFEYNHPFPLSLSDRYIISVGSLGYGRDRVGKLRYAIYDCEANTVELRAIAGPLLPFDYALR